MARMYAKQERSTLNYALLELPLEGGVLVPHYSNRSPLFPLAHWLFVACPAMPPCSHFCHVAPAVV
jgi:hypothetical protein